MIGTRIHKLTVIAEHPEKYRTMKRWICLCDCGNQTIVANSNLKNNHTKSCGCHKKEAAGTHSLTHGKTKTKEYRAWRSMKERCSLPSNIMWKNYGGRGIKICDRWIGSFECFLKDMGELPFKGAQLDRIDNNGNYEPSNCRWVTKFQNMLNKRNTVIVEYNGKSQTLKEWSIELNMNYNLLIRRLKGQKWTVEQTLSTPVEKHRNGRNKRHPQL